MSDGRFSHQVYARRLAAAAAGAARAGLAGLIVTPGYDLRYLIGSRAQTFERLTALVVPAAGGQERSDSGIGPGGQERSDSGIGPGGQERSDSGIGPAGPALVVPRLELAALRESAAADLGLAVQDWVDGENPYDLVALALGGKARVAVTDSMPALHLLPLAERLGATPVLGTAITAGLRMVKDPSEIDALRTAGAAIDRVHARVPEFLKVGRTEAEVAADITNAIVAEGHTEAAFVIVGSGPNGADPHHECSERVLRTGDIVVVDIGGPVEPGYNSDCTRTYSIGDPDPQIAAQYAVLQRAQAAAVAAVRPGVTAQQVDAAARGVLAQAGLAEYFVHRTGHGIGLSVHEEPYIVAGNEVPLEPGMAFSVEPGIYLPGRWGARIEDIVIVTAEGAESVNNRPHDLMVVPG